MTRLGHYYDHYYEHLRRSGLVLRCPHRKRFIWDVKRNTYTCPTCKLTLTLNKLPSIDLDHVIRRERERDKGL